MEEPQPLKNGRDTILDFWRGISILLVLVHHFTWFRFHHIFYGTAHERTLEWIPIIGSRLGGLGVKIFFVISGYIITKMLIEEEATHGRINARLFYIRRFLRILPAYCVYLLFIFISGHIGWLSVTDVRVPCVAFLANIPIGMECGWNFGHLWSLSIEEQFYLFWPAFLLLTTPFIRPNYVKILILSLIALSFSGFFMYDWIDNGISFAHIIVGALYAISPVFRKIIREWRLQCVAVLTIMTIAIPALTDIRSHAHYFQILRAFFPLGALCVISLTYDIKKLTSSRFFSAIAKIGMASYSIYLWQQPFTDLSNRYGAYSPFAVPLLLIPCAGLSYILIEKPVNAWARRRFIRNTAHA